LFPLSEETDQRVDIRLIRPNLNRIHTKIIKEGLALPHRLIPPLLIPPPHLGA
jgi:predicted DNA binding CopG/RHH family protein